MKTWLVENWTEALNWWSVRFALLVTMAPLLYEQVALMRDYLPVSVFHWAMAVLGVLVIIGRLKRQA